MWSNAARLDVLVFGLWLPGQRWNPADGDIDVEVRVAKTDRRSAARAASSPRPDWIVFGRADQHSLSRLFERVAQAAPRARLAVLADLDDLAYRERWLNRGASVYAAWDVEPSRLLTLMRFSDEAGLVAIEPSPRKANAGRRADALSRREDEVLDLIKQGRKNAEIAACLAISIDTAESHVRNLLRKLGSRSRSEAVAQARALGL